MNELSNINLPITDVASIMQHLNVSATELKNPKRFERFKFIAEFIKDIPNKDRFFTRLSKAGQSTIDKVDFFYEYCNHRLQLENAVKQKSFIEEQWIKTGDEIFFEDLQKFDAEIGDIQQTIDTYEN
jgi:hypothetical protein